MEDISKASIRFTVTTLLIRTITPADQNTERIPNAFGDQNDLQKQYCLALNERRSCLVNATVHPAFQTFEMADTTRITLRTKFICFSQML